MRSFLENADFFGFRLDFADCLVSAKDVPLRDADKAVSGLMCKMLLTGRQLEGLFLMDLSVDCPRAGEGRRRIWLLKNTAQ